VPEADDATDRLVASAEPSEVLTLHALTVLKLAGRS